MYMYFEHILSNSRHGQHESSRVRTLDTEWVWSERERPTALTTTKRWGVDQYWFFLEHLFWCRPGFRGQHPGVRGCDFVALPDNICITLRETSLIYSAWLLVLNFMCYVISGLSLISKYWILFVFHTHLKWHFNWLLIDIPFIFIPVCW